MTTRFLRTTESYRQGAQTLAREYYERPEIFERERLGIFRRRWLCVGRSEQIARAGDFFLANIGGESLIVLRTEADLPKAYFNICRHRGTRLRVDLHGRLGSTIQCPYHAWTYNLDGELIGAPHMQGAHQFDLEDYPLHAAGVAEWEGMVFINLARSPEPFAQQYGPLIDRFSQFNLSRLKLGRRIEYDVKANWKLLFLNFSECLHCPVIHPAFSKRTPYQSGFNDLDEGPYLGGYMLMNDETMSLSGRRCAPLIGDIPAEETKRAYYYSIFPNMLLSIFPDYAMVHALWPQGPAATRIVCDWLFHPDAHEREDFNPNDAVELWDITNREDWEITERTQAGILSGAYQPGPYSPRESLLAAWDREYLRQLDDAMV